MEENKNLRAKGRKRLLMIALVVVCGIIAALTFRTTPTSQEPPQEITQEATATARPTEEPKAIPTAKVESEEERTQRIRDSIDLAVLAWTEGKIPFEETSAMLMEVQDTCSGELADYAKEQLAFITIEHEGNEALDLAEKALDSEEFAHAIESLNKIDPTYTKYDTVHEMYNSCEEQVLETVANPTTVDKFKEYIRLLEECSKIYDSQKMVNRKNDLLKELTVFVDVSETIDAAANLFDSQNIEEAFTLLALGLQKYPQDERLATALIDFRDHYLISVTIQVVELCEKEEYKEALLVVEAAIEEYDCEEFRNLREAIKEEKSFLYRLRKDVVEATKSLVEGWREEEFDVKQAANDAGAYVIKSGKNIVLGDYTKDKVTLLSFGGNVALSLLGVDMLLDLRDLSYDVTHWGEEEYFAVWLAADVVAMLPVIGVVKYLSHFKQVTGGVGVATELVDSVADVGKNAENAAEMVDAISDITRVGNDIVDSIDNARAALNAGDAVGDAVSDVAKGNVLLETINQKLVGKFHEVTNVKFRIKDVELSDGRKFRGVFPEFQSLADIRLPENLYKASFYDQQKECLRQLQDEIKRPWSKLRDNFTEEQLDDIANGVLPEGFTWHHNEQEGLMQLVDTLIHDRTGHTGGMSIWGRGYD